MTSAASTGSEGEGRQVTISILEGQAMNIQRSIHKCLRKLGMDIIRYPHPDWLALREHLLTVFSTLNVNCVFDVGAHRGFYASFLRAAGFEGRIVSFEPIRRNFLELQERSSTDSEWHSYPIALADRAGKFTMNVTRRTEFCSFLSPNAYCMAQFGEKGEVVETETVQIERLDGIFDECVKGIARPRVMLKMDTQGYDLKVLEGATGCSDFIQAVQSEISFRHIYDGMPNFEESLGRMAQMGFGLTGLFPVTRDKRLRVIEMDCVMIKSGD
jgi:FkbM family methyltransferase